MEVFREQWPEGPVHKSCSEDFRIGGLSFALHESSRESSCRSEFFLVIHLKRHEVNIFFCIFGACHTGKEHCAPHFHHYGTVSLFGEFSGFDFDCPAVGQFDPFVDYVHESLLIPPSPMEVD